MPKYNIEVYGMKKIVASFIAGALVMVSVQAFGDSVSQIGKKIQTEYTVTVDGEKLTVPAIAVDGKSYAPVRAIGDATGYDVSVSGKSIDLKKVSDQVENSVEQTTTQSVVNNNVTISQEESLKKQAGKIQSEITKLSKEGLEIYVQLLNDRDNSELKAKYDEYDQKIKALREELNKIKIQLEELQNK